MSSYIIFYRDYPRPDKWGACGQTCWTAHALDKRKNDPQEWSIEVHDDWPERRNGVNLLELEQVKTLPENIAKMSREEVMTYFKEKAEVDKIAVVLV